MVWKTFYHIRLPHLNVTILLRTCVTKICRCADPCERRPKMASHRSLSCLLTVKLFINRSTTRVNNGLLSCSTTA